MQIMYDSHLTKSGMAEYTERMMLPHSFVLESKKVWFSYKLETRQLNFKDASSKCYMNEQQSENILQDCDTKWINREQQGLPYWLHNSFSIVSLTQTTAALHYLLKALTMVTADGWDCARFIFFPFFN